MRISDLSRQTGVPVATIKFYLRERLLPPGTPTGRNQAEYGEIHLRQLRLIRAFTGVAQLDLSAVRGLLAAIDDERLPLRALYAEVDRTLTPLEPTPPEVDGVAQAQVEVDRFIDRLGWQVDLDGAGRARFAQVLAALQRLGCDFGVDYFIPYAAAAERLARADLQLLTRDSADRAPAVAQTVLLEVALIAMRRMAQEHLLKQRFGDDASTDGTGATGGPRPRRGGMKPDPATGQPSR